MTHPVETAVAPLRARAQCRAEQEARRVIEQIRVALREANWDLEVAAPYPNSRTESRVTYKAKAARRALFESLTRSLVGSRRLKEPNYVEIEYKKVTAFIEQATKMAAAQYDAFVTKLVSKVGACDSAELDGDHVWAYSFLTVLKGEKKEVYKNQGIINHSKFGIPYQQWRTNLLKNK